LWNSAALGGALHRCPLLTVLALRRTGRLSSHPLRTALLSQFILHSYLKTVLRTPLTSKRNSCRSFFKPALYQGGSPIDTITLWFLIIGSLLIMMGLMGSLLHRLPLSPAMFYLAIGYALGPSGFNLVAPDIQANAKIFTLICESALLISLFAVGLRLRIKLNDRIWSLPWRLALIGMVLSVILMAGAGLFILDLSPGAAILLGAILSPTDPVLASEVQIQNVGDRDRIRFSLSAEGGLNDGTAYPFAMLGLFLLGVHQTGNYENLGEVLHALWGVVVGLGSGWLMGLLLIRFVLYMRQKHRQALGMEEFLALGLIALTYGISHIVDGIGFLAVFAAGVTMRHIEHKVSGVDPPASVIGPVTVGGDENLATDPIKAPAYMAEMVLDFNRQLEHIAEFVMVLLLGILLSVSGWSWEGALIALILMLIVRPLSVLVSLAGSKSTAIERGMIAWFGIRGIGSLYYLAYALQYHLHAELLQRLVPMILTVLAISIAMHGISATPLMHLYYRRRNKDARIGIR